MGREKLSPLEIELIQRWVDAGALKEGEEAGGETLKALQVTERDVMVPILHVRCVVCHGRRKQDGGAGCTDPGQPAERG